MVTRVGLLIAMVVLVVMVSETEAFKWKQKKFKGTYICMGSGTEEEHFIWEAVLVADGKGEVSVAQVLLFRSGRDFVWDDVGAYRVGETGTLKMSWIWDDTPLMSGQLVQKGKGIMVMVGAGEPYVLFTGQCWKEK